MYACLLTDEAFFGRFLRVYKPWFARSQLVMILPPLSPHFSSSPPTPCKDMDYAVNTRLELTARNWINVRFIVNCWFASRRSR